MNGRITVCRRGSGPQRCPEAGGFSLIEVLLSLLIFSVAAVSLVQAINTLGIAGSEARADRAIQDRLDNLLVETSRKPLPQMSLNGPFSETHRENNVSYEVRIEPLEMTNKDNQRLTDLYKLRVTAVWTESRREQRMTSETWLYPPLYAQPR